MLITQHAFSICLITYILHLLIIFTIYDGVNKLGNKKYKKIEVLIVYKY